ncbi:MAG: glycosyltransferase family 2 protein [Gammaproteobacteria bacterium]|nr:glycosyltransferase family 2 protein [Gammaproteobacteria bacterium]
MHTNNNLITLGVCIVNWNSGNLLLSCLLSMQNCDFSGFKLERVVIVDNASHDDSILQINSNQLNLPLLIIHNNENLGFAKACNMGASFLDTDYILFLNPDVELKKKSLKIPLKFLEKPENSNIAVVGVQTRKKNGYINKTCTELPSLFQFAVTSLGLDKIFPKKIRSHFLTNWGHNSTKEVPHVIGAFYLIRNNVFNLLNGFDERFFVYLEDLDLSLRIKQAGYKLMFLSDTYIYHKEGGCSKQAKSKRLFYALQSKKLYAFKHFGYCGGILISFLILFIEPFSRLSYALYRRSLSEIGFIFKAYYLLWYDLLHITLKKRK